MQIMSFSFQGLTKALESICFSPPSSEHWLLLHTTEYCLLLSVPSHLSVLLLSKYAYVFCNKYLEYSFSLSYFLNTKYAGFKKVFLLREWPCCNRSALQAILISWVGLLSVYFLTSCN